MSASPGENYQLAFGLCLIFILLVPFAIAGLALINAGLGRSRSAAHAMTSSLCVISIALLVYFAWGMAMEGSVSGKFLGDRFTFFRVTAFLRSVPWTDGSYVAVLFPILSVGLSSLIPLGAAGD